MWNSLAKGVLIHQTFRQLTAVFSDVHQTSLASEFNKSTDDATYILQASSNDYLMSIPTSVQIPVLAAAPPLVL